MMGRQNIVVRFIISINKNMIQIIEPDNDSLIIQKPDNMINWTHTYIPYYVIFGFWITIHYMYIYIFCLFNVLRIIIRITIVRRLMVRNEAAAHCISQ